MSVKAYTVQGNEITKRDYGATIDMAKELCMLQKTENGTFTYRTTHVTGKG